MSRERARRRAEREAAASKAAAANTARQKRATKRRARLQKAFPLRHNRPTGPLARRRRAQNATLLGIFLLVQLLAWILLGTWKAHVAVLVLSLFLLPVLSTLLFDRRR